MKLLHALLATLAVSLTAPAFSKDAKPKCANAGSPSIPFWKAQYAASVLHAKTAHNRGDGYNTTLALRAADNAMYYACINAFSKPHVQLRTFIIALELNEMMSEAVRYIAKSEYDEAIFVLRAIERSTDANRIAKPEIFTTLMQTANIGWVNIQFTWNDDALREKRFTSQQHVSREKFVCDHYVPRYEVPLPERCRKHLLKHQ